MNDKNNTKFNILNTSKVLFTEYGFDATSLDLIAKKTNLSKAAIYYHFESKEEILIELMKATFAKAVKIIELNASADNQDVNWEKMMNQLFFLLKNENEVFSIALAELLKKGRNRQNILIELPSRLFATIEEKLIELSDMEKAILSLTVTAFILCQSIQDKLSVQLDISPEVFEGILRANIKEKIQVKTSEKMAT